MRENSRVGSQRYVLTLDAKGVLGVLVVAVVALGGAYLAGSSSARAAAHADAAAVPGDALAGLDRPMPAREEPPPVLTAHEALTDRRPLDKSMPVQPVRAAPAGADEDLPPPPAVAAGADAVIAAPRAAPAAAPAPSPLPAAAPRAPAQVAAQPAAPAPRQAVAGGRYTIQVASAPRLSDAERLAHRLAARNPRIAVADVPGKGRWYRVQIGAYDSPEAARRQLPALERSGLHGIVTALR